MRRGFGRLIGRRGGQKTLNVVPRPGALAKLNLPFMGAHDTLHHREAEAAAGKLGGKERIKNPGLCFPRYAGTGIGDLQPDIV